MQIWTMSLTDTSSFSRFTWYNSGQKKPAFFFEEKTFLCFSKVSYVFVCKEDGTQEECVHVTWSAASSGLRAGPVASHA